MIKLKSINDYYERMYELFPDVPLKDIKRILKYYWRQFYLINSYGGDTLIQTKKLWCFTGTLCNDSVKHFHYYIKKLSIKLRILYKRRKVEWNGYYYFALSDLLYEDSFGTKKKRGRPKKIFNFGNLVLYKILDECKIKEFGKKYILLVPIGVDFGFSMYKPNFTTGDAELIIIREPLKFKDILVNNNKYEFL